MKNSLGRASSNSASNKICQFSGPISRLLLTISHSVTTHGALVIATIFADRGSLMTYNQTHPAQTLTILVFHVTWHGKSSMRYGCLIPGRVQACQTEVTQGREWVRVMASQRWGQPRSKPQWVMGFLEMDGQPFYSRKDHHPLCWQAYTKQEFVFQ